MKDSYNSRLPLGADSQAHMKYGRPANIFLRLLCGLVQLTRGIEKTVAGLVEELQQLSVEVRDEDLANVATVSAGGNEVVGPDFTLAHNSVL